VTAGITRLATRAVEASGLHGPAVTAGAVAVVLLVLLVVELQLAAVLRGGGAWRLRRVLVVGIVPLVLVLISVLAVRIALLLEAR
jgi:hypothetical protein